MNENKQEFLHTEPAVKPSRTKKYLQYAVLPAFLLALIGAGTVSAHGLGFFRGDASPEEVAQAAQDRFQHEADLLGISADQVKSGWAKGENLFQIAEENGVTREQLQEKMRAERQQKMQEHLQAMVDSGVITQEQADQRREFMQQRQQDRKTFGRRGMHGPMPF